MCCSIIHAACSRQLLSEKSLPQTACGDLRRLVRARHRGLQVAIEFTTASVTSPGLDLLAERISGQVPVPLPGDPLQRVLDLAETGLHISNNRSLHYSNIRQRGGWAQGSCCNMASAARGLMLHAAAYAHRPRLLWCLPQQRMTAAGS